MWSRRICCRNLHQRRRVYSWREIDRWSLGKTFLTLSQDAVSQWSRDLKLLLLTVQVCLQTIHYFSTSSVICLSSAVFTEKVATQTCGKHAEISMLTKAECSSMHLPTTSSFDVC